MGNNNNTHTHTENMDLRLLFCACMPAKSNKHPSELPKRNRFGRRRVRGSTERSDAERYDKLPTSTDLSKPAAAKAGQPRVPPSYAEAQQLPVVTGRFIESNDVPLKPMS